MELGYDMAGIQSLREHYLLTLDLHLQADTPMRRLIEEAFPLKKVSEDSKHEKNDISPLHLKSASVS